MADFDIFAPQISKVVDGVEGKVMLVHSESVKCGKTTVGSQMPKPLYLRCEQGINAIDGLPYLPLDSWSDFKKAVKQLTSKKPKKMMVDGKEKECTPRDCYTTIIIDTFDVLIRWCIKYTCSKFGVERLNDGNNGYGLWTEYANEWFNTINPLLNMGYFIYGISHSDIRKVKDSRTGEDVEKYAPKGDKRSIDVIIEAVDFLGYVKSNGVDEEGNVIPSSIYFAETDEYMAGSRFEYMPREIKVFSADNIQKAIKEAVKKKEKETGNKAINFEEKKKIEKKHIYTHEEIMAEIKKYMMPLCDKYMDDVKDITNECLGDDIKVSETTKKQMPQLEMVLFELQELASDKNMKI